MTDAHLPAFDDPLRELPILDIVDGPHVPFLETLLANWREWSRLHNPPRRQQFDAVEFPAYLPDLCLIEFDQHANPYRDYDAMYRTIGSRIGDHFGMANHTRGHLSDFGAIFAARWFTVYDRLRQTAQPLTLTGVPYLMNKTYLRFEMLLLPLVGTATTTIDFALFAAHFEPNLTER
jgi:hypothetical protein